MLSRDQYQTRMEAEFRDLNSKVADYVAKVNKATVSARSNFQEQVNTLHSKLFRFQSRLKKIQISSGDDWLMLKDGAESACTDLRRTLENAVARFNLGGD